MRPNYRQEKKLLKNGYTFIAGLDEAGRGSWAGPLVAGAVILYPDNKLKGIRDSKLLSAKKREDLFLRITKNCIAWAAGIATHSEIDEFGIIPANRMAFERAVKKLHIVPDHLLVDGIKIFDSSIDTQFIIKGDRKILSIAAASIVAKVIRDQILNTLHKTYPEYDFHLHKGYGTKKHMDALRQHGVSEIHRLSYKPMGLYNV